jgi:hypothetical protein
MIGPFGLNLAKKYSITCGANADGYTSAQIFQYCCDTLVLKPSSVQRSDKMSLSLFLNFLNIDVLTIFTARLPTGDAQMSLK